MKFPLPRAGLPTFRAALNRVVLLPSVLFLAGILVGSLLIGWSLGIALEQDAAALGAAVASGGRLHVRDLEVQLVMLSHGDSSAQQASLASFERVVRLSANGNVVWSWPPSPQAPLAETLIPQLLQKYDPSLGPQWLDRSVSSVSGNRTLALMVPGTSPGGPVVGIVEPDRFGSHLDELAASAGLALAMIDKTGQPLLGVSARNLPGARIAHNAEQFSYQDNVGTLASQVVVTQLTPEGWVLQLSRPTSEILSPILIMFFVWIPLSALAVLVGWRWRHRLTTQLVGALETLKDETRRITQGDYSEVVESTPFEDLNVVLRDFESMRESVWLRQQDLKDSEYRFRRMFEDAAVGILHTTLDGVPLDLNQAMARMLGYSSPAEALTCAPKSVRPFCRCCRARRRGGFRLPPSSRLATTAC